MAPARFARTITESSYSEWRERILLYAKTESDDLATFPVFYYFLGEFAKASPILALKLTREETDGIARFLIPILSNLWDGPQREATKALINKWIEDAKPSSDNHLFASAKMFLSTKEVDLDLLKHLFAKSVEIKEIATIRQIANVAIARFDEGAEELVYELFLPVIEVLTREGDASWVFEAWYRKEAGDLLARLGQVLMFVALYCLIALKVFVLIQIVWV